MHVTKGKADWIDFLNPTEDDLNWLKTHFHFKDLVLEELLKPSARTKVEAYENHLFLVYYFPSYDPKEKTSRRTEIDIIITRHQVITAHYDKVEPFMDINMNGVENSLDLAHRIFSNLLAFEERQLYHIREELEEIGNRLFKGGERKTLEKISRLKRDISEYRVIVRHQEPLFDSLHLHGTEFWGPEARAHLNNLMGESQKIVSQIESYRETLSDFEDTNNQIMELKMNGLIKTFTVLSFLTFPFALATAVLSMPVRDNPFAELPNAYWILLTVILIGIMSLAIYFQRKKWL